MPSRKSYFTGKERHSGVLLRCTSAELGRTSEGRVKGEFSSSFLVHFQDVNFQSQVITSSLGPSLAWVTIVLIQCIHSLIPEILNAEGLVIIFQISEEYQPAFSKMTGHNFNHSLHHRVYNVYRFF